MSNKTWRVTHGLIYEGDTFIGRAYDITKNGAKPIVDAHNAAMEAAEKLCKLYFEIAAGIIGQEEVRRRRDERLSLQTVSEGKYK